MRATALLTTLALLFGAFASPAPAQRFKEEIHRDMLVRYAVHPDLGPVPLRLGSKHPNLRAKFEPVGGHNLITGPMGPANWYLSLYEFRKDGDGEPVIPITGPGQPELDPEEEEIRQQIEAMMEQHKPAATFEEHIRKDENLTFLVEGREHRGRGKTQPDFTWWEFSEEAHSHISAPFHWYSVAACYQMDENRQAVLLAMVPAWRKGQPQPRHRKWLEAMVSSLQVIDPDEAIEMGINANQARYADTPFKQAELEKARKNIENLNNWDCFTTPNYIVMFSWDYEDERGQDMRKAFQLARKLSGQLEQCREHYREVLPPHDDMLDLYSVLRICYTREEFEKYGGTSEGVVGWFNPGSKELVIFDDRERVYGDDEVTVSTLFHEGWHQYSHTYFGERNELHRWFDEGMGDYFGAHRKAGRGWKHEFDESRVRTLHQMIPRNVFVPLEEIVTWNKDKFYVSDNAMRVRYYSQGYSMVEFLMKGRDTMGRQFDPKWEDIIPTYIEVMRDEKDQSKAVEAAFDGVDWDAMTTAWKDFVKQAML